MGVADHEEKGEDGEGGFTPETPICFLSHSLSLLFLSLRPPILLFVSVLS